MRKVFSLNRGMNTAFLCMVLSLFLGMEPVHSTFTPFMGEDFMDDEWARSHDTPYERSLLLVKKLEKGLVQEGDTEWGERLKNHRLQAFTTGHGELLSNPLKDIYRVYRDERPKELKEKIHPLIKKASEFFFLDFEKLDYFDSLYQQGVNFRKTHSFSDARQCFEQVLSSPDEMTRIKALHNLGSVNYSLHQREDALQYFLKATTLHKELEGEDFMPARNNINKIKEELAPRITRGSEENLSERSQEPQMHRGDFERLPVDVILDNIAPYLSARSMIGVNKFFYSLFTGFNEVGRRGVHNKPCSPRSRSSWSLLKLSRPLPSYEDQAIMPSSIWFNVVKEIDLSRENLPYFRHLHNTNIHTVRLMTPVTDIGDKGAIEFVDNLQGTQVRSLDLVSLGPCFVLDSFTALINRDESIIDNDRFSHLATLINLRLLNISMHELGDDGVRLLLPLKNLQALDVSGNNLSVEGIHHLSHLTSLKCLDISRNFDWAQDGRPLGNEAIGYLSPLKNLQVLYMDRLGLNDEVVLYLTSLESLKIFNFVENQLTDQGVQQLIQLKSHGLTKLRTLGIFGNSFSYQGEDLLSQIYKVRSYGDYKNDVNLFVKISQ